MSYKAVVVTVSDSCFRGEKEDVSGAALVSALKDIGFEILATEVLPDEFDGISQVLRKYSASDETHLIMTTGGTGFGPRDITPEATRQVIQRPAPGLSELLRSAGAQQTPLTWLSRGEAGVCGKTLIVNLPGSPKAMKFSVDLLKELLFHAIDLLHGGKPH